MPIYRTGKTKNGVNHYKIRINYVDEHGKKRQITRAVFGAEEAKELERRLTENIKSEGENSLKKLTVQQLHDEFIGIKKYEVRETTISKYSCTYRYFIESQYSNVFLDKLTVKSLQNWKLSLEQKKLSLNTKKFAFNYFKSLYIYAVKMDYIQVNPFLKLSNFKDPLSVKKKMKVYTPQEFNLFANAAWKIANEREVMHQDLSEWNFYVFFNVAFYTGLRKGEIYALKWNDIDGSYLTVSRTMTQRMSGGDRETPPKNKSSARTIQMPLPLIEILAEHKKRQIQADLVGDDYRICGGEISIRDNTVQRRKEEYAKLAGLHVITLHSFRHTHVSVLANAGINIQEIARRLGHVRIEMTWNTYSHMYPREEEKAVDIFNKSA